MVNKFLFCCLILLKPSIKNYGQSNIFQEHLIQTVRASNDTSIQIYLNFDSLKYNSHELASIYSALTDLAFKKGVYKKVPFDGQQSIKNYIGDYIKSESGLIDEAVDSIENKVVEVNYLINNSKPNKDYLLFLPLLPEIPKNTRYGIVQNIDYNNKRLFVSESSSALRDEFSYLNNNYKKTAAGVIKFNLNYAEFVALVRRLPRDFVQSKNFAVVHDPVFVRLKFDNSTEPNVGTTLLRSSDLSDITYNDDLKAKVQAIPQNLFRDLVVIDYFNQDPFCHGNKVTDVIYQILDGLGLQYLHKNVCFYNVAFLNNTDFVIKYLTNYYLIGKSVQNNYLDFQRSGINTINRLQDKKFLKEVMQKCGECVPEEYVNALMKGNYKDNSTDVITSSFYVDGIDNDMMPAFIDGNTSLVTSARNDDNSTIENLVASAKNDEKEGLTTPPIISEPLYSYFNDNPKCGCIIVGAQIDSSKYFGMCSEDGSGITALGKAKGWGSLQSHINPLKDSGTSFATPEVATKLFIAKAFWRQYGLRVSATEAKTRLILSSDISDRFVGKFASGGSINLMKLLQFDSGFIVMQDNKIVPAEIMSGAITLQDNTTMNFRNTNSGFCGIYYANNKFYTMQKQDQKWVYSNIKNLNFKIHTKEHDFEITDVARFKKLFLEIVTYSKK